MSSYRMCLTALCRIALRIVLENITVIRIFHTYMTNVHATTLSQEQPKYPA